MNPLPPIPRIRYAPIFLGVALMLLGLLLLLDRTMPDLGNRIGPWWPLLIAILGVGRLVDRGIFHMGGHVVIGVSLVLLAASFHRMDLLWHYSPVAVIWLGLIITGRALFPSLTKRPCQGGEA